MFVPNGFVSLVDAASKVGADKIGAYLASGTVAAYTLDPVDGELTPIDLSFWRRREAVEAVETGVIPRKSAVSSARYGDAGRRIYVRLPSRAVRREAKGPEDTAPPAVRTEAKIVKATGRKAKYDWEGAAIEIGAAFFAGDLKLPSSQTEVAERMAQWFESTKQEPPEGSDLRQHAKRILDAMTKA